MSTDVRVRVTPVRVQDGPASCSNGHGSGPSTPTNITDDIADAIIAEAHQPRPCPCRVCVGGCRQQIAARAPWTVCKNCGVHKRHRIA